MRGGRAGENLEQEQGGDHEEELDRCSLRRRRRPAEQWILCRHALRGRWCWPGCVVPDEAAEPGQQDDDANARPEDVVTRRHVAHERLVGPVARVADVRPRTLRRGGPGGPEEEGGQPTQPLGVGECSTGNRIVRSPIAEDRRVVRRVGIECLRARWVDREGAGRGVVRIGAHHGAQAGTQRGLLLGIEIAICAPVLRRRPGIQHVLALAMEPVGSPVGRHVAAVTPDRSDLHPAHRLPDVLTAHDLAWSDDLAAVGGDDAVGNRRFLLVDARADPAEHREPEHHHDAECDPETPHEPSSSH